MPEGLKGVRVWNPIALVNYFGLGLPLIGDHVNTTSAKRPLGIHAERLLFSVFV